MPRFLCPRTLAAILASAALALAPGLAQAAPVTYGFTLTFVSGSLTGEVDAGQFSFDSSSVTPGAFNGHTGLLTDLAITIDGVAYDETMANTGGFGFDAAGQLTSFLFGTDCSGSGCTTSILDSGSWAVSRFGATAAGAHGATSLSSATVSFALQPNGRELPEPSSLALMVLAAGVARFSTRRPS